MDFYKGIIPILETDTNASNDILHPCGQPKGLVARDYAKYPEPMFAPPSDMTIIPKTEWDARYDEQESLKSSLEHVFLNGPNGEPAFINLDQNGYGDCWLFSTGHATMLDRLKSNQPMVRLNPHAGAVILNQLDGGWCGLSAKLAREVGQAVDGTGVGEWPGHARNKKYDTPELRAAMAKHKVTEDWVDMTRQVYDQNLTTLQVATCGFNNIPCPSDFNWWSHSVCQVRWVRIEPGSWGPLILNSWAGWGRYGLGVLRGSQAICNGGLAIRVTTTSQS